MFKLVIKKLFGVFAAVAFTVSVFVVGVSGNGFSVATEVQASGAYEECRDMIFMYCHQNFPEGPAQCYNELMAAYCNQL